MRSIMDKLASLEPSERLRVLNWVVAKAHEDTAREKDALGFAKRNGFNSVDSVSHAELVEEPTI